MTTISYYLQGKIYRKDGKPLKNADVILQNGMFCRMFRTDANGNYKVEVFVFRPCLSGPYGRTYYDERATKEAYVYNDSLLRFDCKDGGASIKSHWAEYYFNKNYEYTLSNSYLENADVVMRDERPVTNKAISSVKENIDDIRSNANQYCFVSRDSLEKMVAYYLNETHKMRTGEVDHTLKDTLEIFNPANGKVELKVFGTEDSRSYFQIVQSYLWKINYVTQSLLEYIDLRNRPITNLADDFGVCSSIIRLEKKSSGIYYLYHNTIGSSWKSVLTVNSKGIIKDYYTSFSDD